MRLVAESCLTLCNLMDWGLPGSSVHGESLGKNTGAVNINSSGRQLLWASLGITLIVEQVYSVSGNLCL